MNKLLYYIKDRLVRLVPLVNRLILLKLKCKSTINVVFFAMSVSMWRYQGLYDIMRANKRFRVFIVIQPSLAYSQEQQAKDTADLIDYFSSQNIPFVLGTNIGGQVYNIKKEISPDILFYPQPYNDYYPKELSYNRFYNKLLCYYPYAFWTGSGDWSYDQPLHRMAWKLFYPTVMHKEDFFHYFRKSANVEVVGFPSADDFLFKNHHYVWKQSSKKKKIIWAPHFTILPGGLVKQSNFLWMADVMLEIADTYSDQIQIVFKPHPRLFTELVNHQEWGLEKTVEYYKKWDRLENAKVELGGFVNLFMTSDAMIHDCGSFAVEYHYTGNPVMYIAEHFEEQLEEKNSFGKLAMGLHYVGKNRKDIIDFIENVVIGGVDQMSSHRKQFMEEYLIPPGGKTVAENTLAVLIKELSW